MINAEPLNVSRNVNVKHVMIAEIVLDEIRQKALDNRRTASAVDDPLDLRSPPPYLCSRFCEQGMAVRLVEIARRRHAAFGTNAVFGWQGVETRYRDVQSRWFGLGSNLSDKHQD